MSAVWWCVFTLAVQAQESTSSWLAADSPYWTYQASYLKLRTRTELWMVPLGPDLSWGGPWTGPAWGGSAWVVDRRDHLQVVQGGEPLTVPALLRATGEPGRADALERTIARKRRNAGFWWTVAGGGTLAVLGGMVRMDSAQAEVELLQGGLIASGGMAALMGGVVAASFPSATAGRLSADPLSAFDPAELQRRLALHNERLRLATGLSEAEALQAQASDPF